MKADIPVIHVDLYRLEDPSAIFQLGLEDYFTPQNIVIIEWADRFFRILPPDYLALHLEHGDTETIRHLTIQGTGPRSTDVVTSLSHSNMDDHSSTNSLNQGLTHSSCKTKNSPLSCASTKDR